LEVIGMKSQNYYTRIKSGGMKNVRHIVIWDYADEFSEKNSENARMMKKEMEYF
jgi:hypothetical protein